MPELPEVETVRAGLEQHIIGKRIARVEVRRRDLRVPVTVGFEQKVVGKCVLSVTRRAKYLLLHLENGCVIIAHLGMSGRLLLRPEGSVALQKHDHIILCFDDGQEMVFNDPRRFGLMLLVQEKELAAHPLFAGLGPEPLEVGFSPEYLAGALEKRTAPIKPTLMDQRVVVGVGNIYASEALFRVGLHPALPASACADKAKALVKAIRDVLNAAIASGGSTLRNYAKASGESGYFQHHFNVYGRENQLCYVCATPIQRITQTGRSTFFCPTCQPLQKQGRRRG